jgi:hypothetical protein
MADYVLQLAKPDPDGLLSGKTLRHLLLMSQLPQDVLAAVWEMADRNQRGKLDRNQLVLLLGLLSMAQSGRRPDPTLVDARTHTPLLEGLQPP